MFMEGILWGNSYMEFLSLYEYCFLHSKFLFFIILPILLLREIVVFCYVMQTPAATVLSPSNVTGSCAYGIGSLSFWNKWAPFLGLKKLQKLLANCIIAYTELETVRQETTAVWTLVYIRHKEMKPELIRGDLWRIFGCAWWCPSISFYYFEWCICKLFPLLYRLNHQKWESTWTWHWQATL